VCDDQHCRRPSHRRQRSGGVVGAWTPGGGGRRTRRAAASFRPAQHRVRPAEAPTIAAHVGPRAAISRRTTVHSGCATTAAATAADPWRVLVRWRHRPPIRRWGPRGARGVTNAPRSGCCDLENQSRRTPGGRPRSVLLFTGRWNVLRELGGRSMRRCGWGSRRRRCQPDGGWRVVGVAAGRSRARSVALRCACAWR